MSILRDLFGAGTWGTGGNLIAAVILGVPGYLLRGPLGRSLAKHLAPHVARHVAEHLANTLTTPASGDLPDTTDAPLSAPLTPKGTTWPR